MSVDVAGPRPRRAPLEVVVTSVSSDSHTWNLVYLQLLLEELGCRVANLGACTPDRTVVQECLSRRPDLVVVSSVNGHGHRDGLRLVTAIRTCAALAATPVVIGGKLDVAGGDDGHSTARLLAAGFDAVFSDNGELTGFRSYLHTLSARTAVPIGVP